jgi:hypothetical protein
MVTKRQSSFCESICSRGLTFDRIYGSIWTHSLGVASSKSGREVSQVGSGQRKWCGIHQSGYGRPPLCLPVESGKAESSRKERGSASRRRLTKAKKSVARIAVRWHHAGPSDTRQLFPTASSPHVGRPHPAMHLMKMWLSGDVACDHHGQKYRFQPNLF